MKHNAIIVVPFCQRKNAILRKSNDFCFTFWSILATSVEIVKLQYKPYFKVLRRFHDYQSQLTYYK